MNRESRSGSIAWQFLMPLIVLSGLLIAYMAYWFLARGEILAWAENWVEAQNQAGYVIEYDRLRVGGFPLRFELIADGIDATAPPHEGGWSIRTDQLTASAMPYDLTNWVIDMSAPLDFESIYPDRRIRHFEASTARLNIGSGGQGTQRIGLIVDDLSISVLEGGAVPVQSIASLRIDSEIRDGDTLRVQSEITDLVFNRDGLDTPLIDAFGQTLDHIDADFSILRWPSLASNGDIANWGRDRGRLVIDSTRIDWGEANLTIDGDLGLDSAVQPEGHLSLYFVDPDAVIARLEMANLINRDNARAMRLLAQAAPRDDRGSALPLSLRRGGVYIGPLRLGDTGSLASN